MTPSGYAAVALGGRKMLAESHFDFYKAEERW